MKMLSSLLLFLIQPMVCTASAQQMPADKIGAESKLRIGMIAVGVVKDVADPIGKTFSARLGRAYEPIIYATSPAFGQSVGKADWDIAIGARSFAVPDKADIVGDLYHVELICVVAGGSAGTATEDFDREEMRVGVVDGSPSDRFISRTLKSAQIVRISLGPKVAETAADLMRDGKMDVFAVDAGIGHEVVNKVPGARILPNAFDTVPIAVIVPKNAAPDLKSKLGSLIAEALADGLVQSAIHSSGHKGLRPAFR